MSSPVKNMSGIAAMIGRLSNRVYGKSSKEIVGIDPNNWPSAGQPITPNGPPGSQSLGFPFWFNQNLNFTPRPDALYDADTLRALSCYPLARILIENTKDQLCQIPWSIELRQMPGETKQQVQARRRKDQAGDKNIAKLSKFFEYPNNDQNWQEWLRPFLDDMLVIDAASFMLMRDRNNALGEIRWTDGGSITRLITERGFTPPPPSPAYQQVYQGMPRIDMTTDDLLYRPRNIAPRKSIASYLYGFSPTEQLADEIKVGMGRLAYVMAFYERGSLGNIIHVVPPRVNPDKIREAMNLINAMLAGNVDQRRMWTMIQGFREDGKDDQIIIPKEPVLADVFDDVLIRKLAFGYGAAPQRLQKPMNRGSANASQEASIEEGIKPYMNWIRGVVNHVIQRVFEMPQYSIEFDLYGDPDLVRQAQSDEKDVKNGIRTRNQIREERGLDPEDNPWADKLTVTLPNGVIELGDQLDIGGGGGGPEPKSKPAGPTSPKKANGRLIEVTREGVM